MSNEQCQARVAHFVTLTIENIIQTSTVKSAEMVFSAFVYAED